MDLRIDDTVSPPSHSTTYFVKKGATDDKYKVYLSLKGSDLPYVDYVIYMLHKSFGENNRTVRVERTVKNRNCSMTIWTWGLFTVKALVVLKDGSRLNLRHYLDYDQEIRQKNLTAQPA